MGVNIVTWRSRIGSFIAKMLKTFCNIAHFVEISMLILLAISIIMIIENILITEGVEINLGPGPNKDLLINCTECGLIWNANQVEQISYNESDLSNYKFVCKFCTLERKFEELLTQLNDISTGLCI